MTVNPFAAIKEIWDTLFDNGTQLYGSTTLAVNDELTLADNYSKYKRIVISYYHNITGNRYMATYYPVVGGDGYFSITSLYTSSNINTAAFKFEGNKVTVVNSTSGTLPYLHRIVGFKTY